MRTLRESAVAMILAVALAAAAVGCRSPFASDPLDPFDDYRPAVFVLAEVVAHEETSADLGTDITVLAATWAANDSRLSGKVTYAYEATGDDTSVGSGTVTLMNDTGRWSGVASHLDSGAGAGRVTTIALEGQDGYEGLSAYVLMERTPNGDSEEVHGLLLPGRVPTYSGAQRAATGPQATRRRDGGTPPPAEPQLDGPTVVMTGEIVERKGDGWTNPREGVTVLTTRWKARDPRLSGDVRYTYRSRGFGGQWTRDMRYASVGSGRLVVANEEGRWSGPASHIESQVPKIYVTTIVLDGQGAYDGLTAYLLMEGDPNAGPQTIRGLLFRDPMPGFTAPSAD